jgi:CheY-like chemotaxis protein
VSVRILLADDQPLIRAGFRMLLKEQPDISVISEAADGAEAVFRVVERERGTEQPELHRHGICEHPGGRPDYVFSIGMRTPRRATRQPAGLAGPPVQTSQLWAGSGRAYVPCSKRQVGG